MKDLTGLGAVADLATTAINKIWPDKSEAEKAELAAVVTLVQGQLEVNKVEAASSSVLTAGWRPAIGWVCGAALAYTYLIYPLAVWVAVLWAPGVVPPKLGNDGMLYELLLGMLGLGGLRTFEKIKGVAS